LDATIELVVRDEMGAPTAARAGLYDATGREVLPSDDAIPILRYGDTIRHVPLRSISAEESGSDGVREQWPHDNRWAMVVDGSYRTDVSPGTYDLILTKGPEYRWWSGGSPWARARPAVWRSSERWTDLPRTAGTGMRTSTWTEPTCTRRSAVTADVHVANRCRWATSARSIERAAFAEGRAEQWDSTGERSGAIRMGRRGTRFT
jgi:hypothetical protein